MTIQEEVQKLDAGSIVRLFELDGTGAGMGVLRFHGHNRGPIVFNGLTYQPYPIRVEGMELNTERPARPTLSVANLDGSISALCNAYDDLVGFKVTVRSTLAKFLDAANFPTYNLLLRTEELTDAYWAKVQCTVADGGELDAIRATAVNTSHYYERLVTGVGATDQHHYSATFKAGQGRDVYLYIYGTSNNLIGVRLNFTTGAATAINTAGAGFTIDSFGARDMGNGEWYVWIAGRPDNLTTSRRYRVFTTNSTGTISYLGDATTVMLNAGRHQMTLGVNEQPYLRVTSAAGNPDADPAQKFPDDVYYVERKSGEGREQVDFELSSVFDFQDVQLPRRQVIANRCMWVVIGGYRGPYCGYTGPPVATASDVATTNPALDDCSGSTTGCKFRFGANGELPYGAFPAAGLVRA